MELSKTQILAVDAAYKTPGVVREIFLSGKLPAIPYTLPKTKDGFLENLNIFTMNILTVTFVVKIKY